MARPLRRLAAPLVGALLAVTLVVPATGQGERFRGTFTLVHGDDLSAGRSVAQGAVLVGTDRTYQLVFDGGEPRHLAGRQVTVTGARSGERIRVASLEATGGDSGDGSGGGAVAAAINKKVAFILVNFATDTRQPWTVAQATGAFLTNANSVKNYFDESSYGIQETTGEVLGWYTVNVDPTNCPYGQIASAADAAVAADKGSTYLSQFTNRQYVFPGLSCGWSGLAYLPGSQSWLNGTISLRVSSHELSHNFGVHHASTMTCTEGGVRVSLSANSANCTYSEYGDPFTVMGAAATRHSHTQHKAQMGWVPTAERLQVTSPGNYSLGVNEHPSASPKVIRVARTGVSNQYFYLEYRQPYGTYFDNFSSTDPAVNGVTVRLAADYTTRTQSRLIDMNPSTTTFGDAPLAVGRTFSDPLSGVTITTQSVSSSGATVSIAFSADTQAPSAPGSLVANPTGSSSVDLSWTASTDDVGVAGYRVSRDGTQVAQVSGTSWTDTGRSPSTTYAYGVVAFDAAGNVSAAATTSATTPGDTQSPSAPGDLAANPTSSSSVDLSWTASTDDVGVAGYRVSRDGTQVAQVSGTSWTDTGLAAATSYTYSVVAFDAAGNVSAEAAVATTTMPPPDSEPPTAPVLSGTLAKGGQVALSWTGSTDDVGVVGYRIYRNGVLLATTTSTSYTVKKTTGTNTYHVVAFDAAGNVSAASNSVTLTTESTGGKGKSR